MGDNFAGKGIPQHGAAFGPGSLESSSCLAGDFSQGCEVRNADPGPATNSSPVGSTCEIRLEAEVFPTWAAPAEMGRVELTMTCSVSGQNFVTKALREN